MTFSCVIAGIEDLKGSAALVLAYPDGDPRVAAERLRLLREAGVDAILLEGPVEIGGCRVLGKGCNSIVLRAIYRGAEAVVKVLRLDAQRQSLSHEAEILKAANGVGVGPRLYLSLGWAIVEEYVPGIGLEGFLEAAVAHGRPALLRYVLARLILKCHALDTAGIDHGELSRAHRHVIVSPDYEPRIIDFESASMSRRPRNTTSITQYVFYRSAAGRRLLEAAGLGDRLLNSLREYKRSGDEEALKSLLEVVDAILTRALKQI